MHASDWQPSNELVMPAGMCGGARDIYNGCGSNDMMLLGELLLSAELVLGVLRLLLPLRRKSSAGSLGRPRGLSWPTYGTLDGFGMPDVTTVVVVVATTPVVDCCDN